MESSKRKSNIPADKVKVFNVSKQTRKLVHTRFGHKMISIEYTRSRLISLTTELIDGEINLFNPIFEVVAKRRQYHIDIMPNREAKTNSSQMNDGLLFKTRKTKLYNSAKYKSFGLYLKTILASSLITSFPEIAKSKSWVKKTIKIIVFVMCLIGFTYQTLDFMWMYLAYPTVVNVFVSNPYEVVQPALTVCNKNRKRRINFCSVNEKNCEFSDPKEFCIKYPAMCPGNNPNHTYPGKPLKDRLVDKKFDWKTTFAEAHNETIIKLCFSRIEEKTFPCNQPYKRIPVVDAKGEPNVCFTIDSLMGQPDAPDKIYPNTYHIEIHLDTQGEEYVYFTDRVLIQMMIHDRRALVNPFSEGTSLEAGIQYNAYVSMTSNELLPPPYDTNCFDYLEQWKKNNGTGPLNHMMCVEYCKLKKLEEMGKCIDKDVDFIHTEQLCPAGYRSITSDIVKNCSLQCGKACYEASYNVRYEKLGANDRFCAKDDIWCKNEKVLVTVVFNKFRLNKYVYQPKFASVEMFSYIGGYMGMWLGLSLISLFDLYETICYLLFYPIGRKMRLKAKQKASQAAFGAGDRHLYYNRGTFY
ncbi:hypothetical protein AVEN_134275-1 [Araneus ventricosus]|uniref:Uncharacterized protein n=1 Tax=Araneus ventricosus TaxID=182803 RepID=A0A4Y2KI42_ARAVE|nr:hypothetical protein AVEN_134275-1 [Araneus ventricosus]